MNQHAKYLSHRSFSSKLIVRSYCLNTHWTDCPSWTTKVVGKNAVECVYDVSGFWITCQTCACQTMLLFRLHRSWSVSQFLPTRTRTFSLKHVSWRHRFSLLYCPLFQFKTFLFLSFFVIVSIFHFWTFGI